ncbi:MAG: hypothetical protein H6574_12075 [Lewinellaceae bacterium]|nr:hypothetical protein [Lewinellaceae bacterium]
MGQIDLSLAVQAVNSSFEHWGLPLQIKIDNGLPFVLPWQVDLPTLAILWWVGLGIEVIRNKPRCPQQNGMVEGLQGTCHRWVNPSKYSDLQVFQVALNENSQFHIRHYRMPAKQYKTRIELYPELLENKRIFSADAFQMERVHAYLARQVWKRIVKKNGNVTLFAQEIYVGEPFRRQDVTLTFDPIDLQWVIRSTDGRLLKTSKRELVREQEIWKCANMSKNAVTT